MIIVNQGRRFSGYEITWVPDPRGKQYYLVRAPQRGITASCGDAYHKAIVLNEIAGTPLQVYLTRAL